MTAVAGGEVAHVIRFAHPERTKPAPALLAGARLDATPPPRCFGVAVYSLLALCVHMGAFAGLIALRQAASIPSPPPEATIELVSLPSPESASASSALPTESELVPRPIAEPSTAPAPAAEAEAAPAPEPDRPPAPMPMAAAPPPTALPLLLSAVPPAPIGSADLAAPELAAAPLQAMPVPAPQGAVVSPIRPQHRPVPVKLKVRRPAPDVVELAEAETKAAALPGLARNVAPPATVIASVAPAHNAAAEAAFEARIREAVQEAVHYPTAARMMGVTGRARLELAYQAGSLSGVSLVQSAGTSVLDDAAVTAARAAHYPPPPPEVGDHPLRFLLWVNFTGG